MLSSSLQSAAPWLAIVDWEAVLFLVAAMRSDQEPRKWKKTCSCGGRLVELVYYADAARSGVENRSSRASTMRADVCDVVSKVGAAHRFYLFTLF